MEKILLIIGAVAFGATLLWALGHAMNQNDIAQCYRWQEQATQYKGFYLTKAEAAQCEYWKINIGAPVLK